MSQSNETNSSSFGWLLWWWSRRNIDRSKTPHREQTQGACHSTPDMSKFSQCSGLLQHSSDRQKNSTNRPQQRDVLWESGRLMLLHIWVGEWIVPADPNVQIIIYIWLKTRFARHLCSNTVFFNNLYNNKTFMHVICHHILH